MIAHKHIEKIVAALTAVALCLCLCAVVFSGALQASASETGLSMEYEEKLFSGEPITVNILMEEDEWEEMLQNAIQEEYYQCDVEINGQTFYRVGIRPKGNTSLTSIASDPDTDRYSFKLEFDKYVDGQTCWGLDKLVLNNNYADATNMREALIYDMYHYLDADASLCSYASISINGDYWGVYLALEAVEDSFLLRNFGAENGEIYKPEGVGGGAGGMKVQQGAAVQEDAIQEEGGFRQRGAFQQEGETGGPQGELPTDGEAPQMPTDGEAPQMADGEAPQMPADGELPEDFAPGDRNQGFGGFGDENAPAEEGDGLGAGGNGGKGGGMMGAGGGADLNYIDDDLDSYSTIWEGEVTSTSDSDHKRVVQALKSAAAGEDLEDCLDVDNLLRYMAVHVFSVNQDSLSGSMAHNYYLYEHNGRLNLFPWDYNLALGGMGMGNSSASSVINDAIDTPFDGTDFFDALLENEEYLSRYHAYLSQLVEGYVFGGELESFYERTRASLDSLVENDPTAFYTYEEYDVAAEALMELVKLRGQSVRGQLDGSIPSTDDGQRQDSSALIDGSSVDISLMGAMNQNDRGRPDFTEEDAVEDGAAVSEAGEAQQDGQQDQTQDFARGGKMAQDFGDFAAGEQMAGQETGSSLEGVITYLVCFVVLIAALLFAKFYRRRSIRR